MNDEEISTKLIRMGYRKKMMRSRIERGLDYAYYEHPTRIESFSFWGNGEWLLCNGSGILVMGLTRRQMEEKLGQMNEVK